MALPLNLTPGAARRDGGGRSIWPPEPPILVDPASLRPGQDLVRIRAEASPAPVAPGTWCLYLGHTGGMAVVLRAGGSDPVPVPAFAIDEPDFLMLDGVDPYEWMEGWAAGRYAEAHEEPVSTRSRKRVPATAYSRGFAAGFKDVRDGREYRPGSCEPYNRYVRAIAVLWPDEHFVPTLPRLRTLMAVAA